MQFHQKTITVTEDLRETMDEIMLEHRLFVRREPQLGDNILTIAGPPSALREAREALESIPRNDSEENVESPEEQAEDSTEKR